MSDGNPRPWDRREGESQQAYSAFLRFRDLGPSRMVVEAYRQEQRARGRRVAKEPHGRWFTWLRQHQWAARALAWDAFLREQAEQVTRDAIHDAINRHIAEAKALQELALRRIKQDREATDVKGQLGPGAVAATTQALTEGVALERLSLGLPSTITRTEQEVSAIVDASLRLWDQLLALFQTHVCAECQERIRGEIESLTRVCADLAHALS